MKSRKNGFIKKPVLRILEVIECISLDGGGMWNDQNWALTSARASKEARSHACERPKVRSALINSGDMEQSSLRKWHCFMDFRYISTTACLLDDPFHWLCWTVKYWLVGFGADKKITSCITSAQGTNVLMHLPCGSISMMTSLSLMSLELFFFSRNQLQKYENDSTQTPKMKKK